MFRTSHVCIFDRSTDDSVMARNQRHQKSRPMPSVLSFHDARRVLDPIQQVDVAS